MTTMVTHKDIRDFLEGFAAAIELDQVLVDALPQARFHPSYDDRMWRRYRRAHLTLLDRLVRTVDDMPLSLLQQLSQVATTYDTATVQDALLEEFREVGTGMYAEEVETAARFFSYVLKNMLVRPGAACLSVRSSQMVKWFRMTDPLRIAEDPECGYGRPAAKFN